jgi:hypothetical protein
MYLRSVRTGLSSLLCAMSFFCLLHAQAPAPANGQSNNFDLQANMKSIGHDTYTLAKAKQGYKLTSRFSYHLSGMESEVSDEFKFSDTFTYVEGAASSISSQMHTSYIPNKARTELVVGMVQAGVQDSKHLPIKPDFVIMPHYDAGAAQAMLLLATTHPTADNLYNVVVPGATGATPPRDPSEPPGGHQAPGNNAYDALWTKGPDATGTLDGKPVALHSYVLTGGKNTWSFFADTDGTLMQLDNSMVHASYVRAKFKLDLPQ